MRAEHHGMDFYIIFNSEDDLLDLTTEKLQIPSQEVNRSRKTPLRTGNGELQGTVDWGGRNVELILRTVNGNSYKPRVSYDAAVPKKITMELPIDLLRHIDLLHSYACPYDKGDGVIRFSFAQQP